MIDLVSEDLIALQSPEAREIIRALVQHIEELHKQIHSLQSKVEELQRHVNLTPANSTKPPSTVHPHARPKPRKPRGKKRQGGQPGHQRHTRPLEPGECCRCHQTLAGDAQPHRHRVFELPESKPIITEYQSRRGGSPPRHAVPRCGGCPPLPPVHTLACPCCGVTTQASLPQGVTPCTARPCLVSFTALLMGYFRQSKRRSAEFFSSLLNVPASASWVVKLQNRAAETLGSPYQKLAHLLPAQPCLGIDE